MDTFYEVTVASSDMPKLLCRLSECLVSVLALACPKILDTGAGHLPICKGPSSSAGLPGRIWGRAEQQQRRRYVRRHLRRTAGSCSLVRQHRRRDRCHENFGGNLCEGRRGCSKLSLG